MKSIHLSIMATLLLNTTAIAQKKQTVSTIIDKVTVFTQGAQVTRSANTSITAGNTILVFQDVSSQLVENSIQVNGQGEFTILSVSTEKNYLKTQQNREEISKLQQQEETLLDKLTREKNNQKVYTQEEAMLMKNQEIGSTQTGVKTPELREAMDFHRARLGEVLEKQAAVAKAISSIQKELTAVQVQLAALNNNGTQPTSDLLVTISSKENINGKFTISYLVNNAGWTPAYDLKVKDISHPMELVYKANVYQYCGEEWKNVKLSLSTGNPSQNATMPQLQPWYLGLDIPRYQTFAAPVMEEKELNEVVVVASGVQDKARKKMTTIQVTESFTPTTVTFDIAHPYTIVSDGKPYTVSIKEVEVPAEYKYYAAPKLDKAAYLVAGITNWETLNLLPGETSIYFEDTYLGKSHLDLQNAGDTLQVSLGRDKGIVVNRTLQKDFSQRQFLGSSTTVTRHFELSVRNNKRLPIHLVLQDQLPVSVSKEIEIMKVDVGDALQDETSKMVSWNLNVEPGKDAKKNLKYAVKYPKGKVLNLD